MASNRFMSRPAFSERVVIPEGILVGAVIGKGGSNSKRIVATHGVRFNVDSESRVVTITGTQSGINGAVSDLLELFERLRRQSHTHSHSHPHESVAKAAHAIAVKRHGRESTWCFERVSPDGLGLDPSVKDPPYRLTEYSRVDEAAGNYSDNNDEEDEAATSWISEFNPLFQERMVRDVMKISQNIVLPIKIKAAFGQQCFGLPDTALANGPKLQWEQLQQLQLHSQIKPRWSNAGKKASPVLFKLLGELEALNTTETPHRQDLTVYMNSRSRAGRHWDLSVKFRRVDGVWVPVERRPMRVVHALYNIAMGNDAAFRIRVYSREDAPETLAYAELASHLEISERVAGDFFSTEVKVLPGCPSDLVIQNVSVKETTHVHWNGLRFAVSYTDASHENVSVACTLAPLNEEDTAEDMSPENALDDLVNKVISLTKP